MRIFKKLKLLFHKDLVCWQTRYSDTMEDDNTGRWARVAYAGKFNTFGFHKGQVCRWEIAWISKLKFSGKFKFIIHYKFPSNGICIFDDLEDAKLEVEKSFKWFIKCVI